MNELNTVTRICFHETLIKFDFMLSLFISLKLLFKELICVNKS